MKKQIREIRIIDLFGYFLLPMLLITGIWLAFGLFLASKESPINVISLIAAIILTYVLLKYFLIGAVLMYKAFAPLEMRNQCRFEPTCSTYMIMVLKRYGAIIGLIKGIRRIVRCRPPNGGIDYPY